MTTPKKSARVRKPKDMKISSRKYRLHLDTFRVAEHWDDHKDDIVFNGTFISLDTAKKLHTWLGKAIKYLEGKK